MDFFEKYRPPQAPSGKTDGSTSGEEWPADIPDYCKGVEVYPDEPFLSLGDGLGKIQGAYRADIKRNERLDEHSRIDAVLYWFQRSQDFYKGNEKMSQGLSIMGPSLEELKEKVTKGQHEGVEGLLDRLREAKESLDQIFQVETGKLTTSTAVALFPLMRKGLNPKVLEVISERVSREKAVGLLKLISDHQSGGLDDEGLQNGIETLFADELK